MTFNHNQQPIIAAGELQYCSSSFGRRLEAERRSEIIPMDGRFFPSLPLFLMIHIFCQNCFYLVISLFFILFHHPPIKFLSFLMPYAILLQSIFLHPLFVSSPFSLLSYYFTSAAQPCIDLLSCWTRLANILYSLTQTRTYPLEQDVAS